MSTQTIISRKFVEKTLELEEGIATTLRFYPVRLPMLLSLRNILGDVAKAVNKFMVDPKLYAGYKREQSGEPEGSFSSVEEVQGLTDKMASRMEQSKEEAIELLLELLVDERKQETIAKLVADSLRDETYSPSTIMNTDVYVMASMVFGVAEANMSIFRPIQEGMGALSKQTQTQETNEDNQQAEQKMS